MLRYAFFLLARVPVAAREPDFASGLNALRLEAGSAPGLMDVSAAMISAIDERASRGRSDLGEMAGLAAVGSLQAVAGQALEDLFGSQFGSAERTRLALADLATVKQFGILARDFFSRLVRSILNYHLGRALPNYVGIAQRFTTIRELMSFEDAVELHCREAAHVITRFAGEWHSKADFEGGITENKAGGFIHHAFEKLRAELRTRSQVHA